MRRPARASAGRREGYAKSRETRAQLLAATLAEATERGLHETSVATIAARANAAVGSLNYHFGSRDTLLREPRRRGAATSSSGTGRICWPTCSTSAPTRATFG